MQDQMSTVDLVSVMSAILLTSEYVTKGPTSDTGIKTAVETAVKIIAEVGKHPTVKPAGRG